MKATGIVRRNDDLGRIVIPKEIRRTLRIRMDPLTENIDTGYPVLYGCEHHCCIVPDCGKNSLCRCHDVFVADHKGNPAVQSPEKGSLNPIKQTGEQNGI